jgi:soluble lytic murein transglycosylase-like protein
MDQEAQLIKDQMTALRQENERLAKRNEQRIYINDLAVEFSMDPTIVTLVDRYSRKYMKESGPEWRLVRNPEFLSYIMLSLIYVESKGDTHAVGDRGRARGLTQIWVSTAQDYGEVTAEALHRPETNISFAFKHFHQLLKKYQGNVALTLYAWNRGSRKVDRLLEYGESPGNGYAKKVYEAALVNNQELLIGTP